MAIYKLKDVCLKIGSGATPRGGKEAYCDEGISLIRSQNVLDFTFSYDGLAHINDQQAEKLSNVEVNPGDILLNITGDSVARVCVVDSEVLPARVNQHVAIIRPDKNKVISSYILFFLQMIKPYLQQIAAGGATRNALTKSMIENLEIEVPDILLQKKIVAVLDDIQEKIRDNNEINKNLEQQAQAVYYKMFSEVNTVPVELSNIIDVRDGTHDSPNAQATGYHLITSKHLLPFGVDKASANHISKTDFDKINERSLVETQDILMSMIGTIGLISYIPYETVDFAIKNVALFKTSHTPELAYYFLCYLKSGKTLQHIGKCLAGSTQKYISLGELRKMPIYSPTTNELREFNCLVKPMFEKIISCTYENALLEEMRDSLLPKLISGELDVSNIDI